MDGAAKQIYTSVRKLCGELEPQELKGIGEPLAVSCGNLPSSATIPEKLKSLFTESAAGWQCHQAVKQAVIDSYLENF